MPGGSARRGSASYTAQLLVSELVTNVVLHARTDLHLGITADADTLLITVTDGDPEPLPDPPATRSTGAPRESGRGLAIVRALATDVGWRGPDDGIGKIIWFTLRLPVAEGV